MSPVAGIALLWLAFAGSHLLLSHPPVRGRLVTALGARVFTAAYGLLALGLFVPLVSYYLAHRHAGPLLWSPPAHEVLRGLVLAANALAFVLIAAGLVKPAPSALGARDTTVRGVLRVTRHPVFMGTALWGAAHLVVNGHAADVVFFGGFPVLAIAGCLHQDARLRATRGEPYRAFAAATPFVPFTGRHALLGLREISPIAWTLGLAAAVVLRALHPWFRTLAG